MAFSLPQQSAYALNQELNVKLLIHTVSVLVIGISSVCQVERPYISRRHTYISSTPPMSGNWDCNSTFKNQEPHYIILLQKQKD